MEDTSARSAGSPGVAQLSSGSGSARTFSSDKPADAGNSDAPVSPALVTDSTSGHPTDMDPANAPTSACPDAGAGAAPTRSDLPLSGPHAGTDQASLIQVPQIEGYYVIGKLGEGGMGTVWRAVQLGTQRQVALKVMQPANFVSTRARNLFAREVELAASVDHPNIARVYATGLSPGAYYYAMELVDGMPIDTFVRLHRLSVQQTLSLFKTVCLAVQHAHQHGIIHRDLKPSNILVDDQGHPHVVDFGLAIAFSEQGGALVSHTGAGAGTPGYMSPEQAAGHVQEITTRSDIYSMGVILYRLLTGSFPHDICGSEFEVRQRIRLEEIHRPRQVKPDLDPLLEGLLLRVLAKDPEQRYRSLAEFADDIEKYLCGRPTIGQQLTGVRALLYALKQYPLPAAASITAIVALGFVGALVGIGKPQINTLALYDLLGFLAVLPLGIIPLIMYFCAGRHQIDLLCGLLLMCYAIGCAALFMADNVVAIGRPSQEMLGAGQMTLGWFRAMYIAGLVGIPIQLQLILRYAVRPLGSRARFQALYLITLAAIPAVFSEHFLAARSTPTALNGNWRHVVPWMPDVGPLVYVYMLAVLAVQVISQVVLWRMARDSQAASHRKRQLVRWMQVGAVAPPAAMLLDIGLAAAGYRCLSVFPLGSFVLAITWTHVLVEERGMSLASDR